MAKAAERLGLWRSRWAAVGAAVAVVLGAGGLVGVGAVGSESSVFVAVEPTRILDTRSDVGLAGPFVSGVSQKLQVTGVVATQPAGGGAPVSATVVPVGASSVVFNVTVVRPGSRGFLSIRPGDASGVPATSNINFGSGGPNVANAVTVQLPVSGLVDVFVNGSVGEVLVDVAGYFVPGSEGAVGPRGPAGPKGEPGVDGVDGVSPERVVWVAAGGGDFTSLSAALASITDASAQRPYVVRVAPGVYTETSTVVLKDHVDVEGSGQAVTTIQCACSSTSSVFNGAVVVAQGITTAEIRHLTVDSTGGDGDSATGVFVDQGSLSMLHVTATATGTDDNNGVWNEGSSPLMNHVTATATGGANSYGVYSNLSSTASVAVATT